MVMKHKAASIYESYRNLNHYYANSCHTGEQLSHEAIRISSRKLLHATEMKQINVIRVVRFMKYSVIYSQKGEYKAKIMLI